MHLAVASPGVWAEARRACSLFMKSDRNHTKCLHKYNNGTHRAQTPPNQKMWSGIRIRIFRLIRIYIRMSAGSVPNVVDSFSCRGVSFVSFPCKKWNSLQGGQVPLYRCCWGGIKWPRAVFSCLVTSSDSKSWYCFQHVCLSVCLCLCVCVWTNQKVVLETRLVVQTTI